MSALTPAQLAKGALRRLAQAQLEPTPEHYARAYAQEAADADPAGAPLPPPAPDAKALAATWAAEVERLAKNLERGGRQWPQARRRESLKRLFDGSRSDAARLLQRLQSLMAAWETDADADPLATAAGPEAAAPPAGDWPKLTAELHGTVTAALAPAEPNAERLAGRLAALADALARDGALPEHVAAVADACVEARRLFAQRHRLVDELAALAREMGAGIEELAEDESWARAQGQTLKTALTGAPSLRGVRAAAVLLEATRRHQHRLRADRAAARDALKQLIHDMLLEVGEIGDHAGRFELATARHADSIAGAESLQGLAGAVKALLDDTRAMQSAVGASKARLLADRERAGALETRVRELEAELRRLADEVATDALTQLANRRGLERAFDDETARAGQLAVGLIDIDNFKKLNDSLGHAAGDIALKSLAAAVRERLRPVDHLARFGGEEFVVLMPGTDVADAQAALTRLQRSLSEALFLHDGREVFVTFSAGVTAWRPGEPLQAALERADQALYDAKRNGKNRTCSA